MNEYRQIVEATLLTQKLKEQIKEKNVPTEAKQVYLYAILVDTKEEASQVIERLHKGEDFAALAAEVSTDETTKPYGGNLGWVPQGVLISELDQAAFSIEAGNVSEPIATSTGYYVIKVSEIAENRLVDDQYREILASNELTNWFKEQRNVIEIREYLDQTKATWAVNHIT